MKKIIIRGLAFFSRAIIKKYQPQIIAISGSVGKTSAKEMIALVLEKKYRLRSSIKNYNNEFGLPLTIIGRESAGRNIFAWLEIYFRALVLLLKKDKNYPEVLVLEMGIDREGDMDYLLSIIQPDIAILTNISHSHAEHLGSIEKIKKEKLKLLKGVKEKGLAIFNYDNKHLQNLSKELTVKNYSYGLGLEADFRAKDLNYIFPDFASSQKNDFYGLNLKLEQGGSVLPLSLPKVISEAQLYSVLSALVVGFFMDLNLIEISENFKKIKNIPGRMSLVAGLNQSLIIDDTYNASPESASNALLTMKKMTLEKGFRKIVVLGDMLELGYYSREGHQLLGAKLFELKPDLVLLLGDKIAETQGELLNLGFPEKKIFFFSEKEVLIDFLKKEIKAGDLILVKASQGLRFEKIVKAIMADPQKATELLVRQEEVWLQK